MTQELYFCIGLIIPIPKWEMEAQYRSYGNECMVTSVYQGSMLYTIIIMVQGTRLIVIVYSQMPLINANAMYTTFTNFSMEYHLMCKVYTDVGAIK